MKEMLEKNRKDADFRKGSQFRDRTHCKNGHSFADQKPRWSVWRGSRYRRCTMCEKARGVQGVAVPRSIAKEVERRLLLGDTLTSIAGPGQPGYIIRWPNLHRLRRENPKIAKLCAGIVETAQSRAQTQRHAHERFINGGPAVQSAYYREVCDMIPRYIPVNDRDDIVSNIFRALTEKSLRHADVRNRVALFVADHNRAFPTRFAKFGDAQLLSLDETMFDDGSTTRGDTISRGLWD